MTDDYSTDENPPQGSPKYSEIRPQFYYNDEAENEWERLAANPKAELEFDNTIAYLESYLPESGQVLDAGGAAGRYSIWLANQGYDVTLTDISKVQLQLAQEKCTEHGVSESVDIGFGDIRALPFNAGSFDAVCCLGGPLSHVIDEADRRTAIQELRRVSKPGAPVFVSVMGFIAVLERLIQVASDFEQEVDQLPGIVETRTYSAELLDSFDIDEPNFVECYFFRAAELEQLLSEHGITVDHVVGLEGVASNFEQSMQEASEEATETIRDVISDPAIREDPTVADLSNHILAVGHVVGDVE